MVCGLATGKCGFKVLTELWTELGSLGGKAVETTISQKIKTFPGQKPQDTQPICVVFIGWSDVMYILLKVWRNRRHSWVNA